MFRQKKKIGLGMNESVKHHQSLSQGGLLRLLREVEASRRGKPAVKDTICTRPRERSPGGDGTEAVGGKDV